MRVFLFIVWTLLCLSSGFVGGYVTGFVHGFTEPVPQPEVPFNPHDSRYLYYQQKIDQDLNVFVTGDKIEVIGFDGDKGTKPACRLLMVHNAGTVQIKKTHE